MTGYVSYIGYNQLKRQEWLKIKNKDFVAIYGFEKSKPYYEARERFKEQIAKMQIERPEEYIVLHHINIGCDDYELWNPVVPMYQDEHHLMHMLIFKNQKKATFKQKMQEFKGKDASKMYWYKQYQPEKLYGEWTV